MSYKLYDFSQDPKLDEQIRLLCDVLFNRREVYEGQLSSPTLPWWIGKTLFWAFPTGNSGQILIDNQGTTATRTSPAAVTEQDSIEEYYANCASATSGSRAGYAIGGTNTPFLPNNNTTIDTFSYCPYMFLRMRFKQSISNLRFHVIVGNQAASNTDSPWGTVATTSGGLAFSYLPATSANWLVRGKTNVNGTALSFDIDTQVPVVLNAPFNLEISVRGQGSNRSTAFYINGVLVHSLSGNTSYGALSTATTSQIFTSLYPTENATKQFGIAFVVWGYNGRQKTNTDLMKRPAGFTHWTQNDNF